MLHVNFVSIYRNSNRTGSYIKYQTTPCLQATLSDSEKLRAARFLHDSDKLRYAMGRALARWSIITLCPVEQNECASFDRRASAISIVQCGSQKPTLSHLAKRAFLGLSDFNISHDGKWVACAAVGCGLVGIDVAEVACPLSMDEHQFIAEFETQLTEKEALWLGKSSNALKDFMRIWTVKEAYTKLTGEGITMDLARINVDIDTSTSPQEARVSVSVDGVPAKVQFTCGELDEGNYLYTVATTAIIAEDRIRVTMLDAEEFIKLLQD